MLCVPSVIILAFILESILWCHLVVGILFLGFEPEIHRTYFMMIVFARSFRLLVTFALVLEVRGISFFQILWTILAEVPRRTKRSQPECSWWVLHSISWLCQFYLSTWVIWKIYVELVCHTKFVHPQLRKPYVPLSCLSLVVFWPLSINW